MFRRFLSAAIVLAVVAMVDCRASARTIPNRPVKIVVPFAPGAGNDTLGRLTAEYLTPRLGQPVDRREQGRRGIADRHRLRREVASRRLQPRVGRVRRHHDPARGEAEHAVQGAGGLHVHRAHRADPVRASRSIRDLPIKNVAELIAYAKANPGKVKYGTSGIGGGPHMGSALIEKAAGVEMLHVPYSGVAPAITRAARQDRSTSRSSRRRR